jgi:UDP-perosamine 4-acetyltransferase
VTEAGDGRSIIVVGAGGHAKVVIDCLRFAGWNVVGCTDADGSPRKCAGVSVIGTDEKLDDVRAEGVEHAFCALGANGLRDRVGASLVAKGFQLPAVCGAGAVVSAWARIGTGVVIMPGALVNVESSIGELAIINTNSNVDHDCVIGRAAHIGPGAALAGEVQVGDRTFVGTGCAIVPQVRIGADSVVGAGSVVVRDVPAGVVAFGNPARVRRSI